MRDIKTEKIGKDEHENDHVQQRVQKRPDDSEIRTLVAGLEIGVDHAAQDKDIFLQPFDLVPKRVDQFRRIVDWFLIECCLHKIVVLLPVLRANYKAFLVHRKMVGAFIAGSDQSSGYPDRSL